MYSYLTLTTAHRRVQLHFFMEAINVGSPRAAIKASSYSCTYGLSRPNCGSEERFAAPTDPLAALLMQRPKWHAMPQWCFVGTNFQLHHILVIDPSIRRGVRYF
jgi:hypothetical protein